MPVKTFYFPIDVLLVLLQVKVTKLDNTCLVGLILSSIALFVKKNVIDSVSGSAIDFRRRLSNYKSHIKKQKCTCRLVNHFIDNSSDHPLDCLKFTLIEQISNKTEKDLEEREGYWQAQLWTFEPFGFNAKKNLIQAGVVSFCVNLFISRSWSLNKPYYLWSYQQILTLVLRVLLILDC